MVAQERADVFLRHRGAVLETLLADPSFAQSSPSPGAAPQAVSAGSRPVVVETPVASNRAEGAAMAPGPSPGEYVAAPPSSGEIFRSGEPSGPAPRRTAAGPKASERILALLNGETTPAAAGLEYSGNYSEVASKLTAPAKTAPDPAPPTRAAGASPAGGAPALQNLLVQVRKPKVALALAGVLVVLLVLLLVTTSGDEKPTSQIAVITPAPTTATQPPTSTTPPAAPIQVKSAVSHCPPGGTPGMDAFSGDGKAWSCARAYNVDGQVLTVNLGRTYEVDSIGIVPGWDHVGADGTDEWAKYRTVSRISYRFDDAVPTTYTQQTLDQRMLVVTKLNPPVRASKVVLTVLASKGDPSVNTTAISSIVITGH